MAGFDLHMAKPMKIMELLVALQQVSEAAVTPETHTCDAWVSGSRYC